MFGTHSADATIAALQNGGAESGNTGWLPWGNFTTRTDTPHSGSRYFAGGENNASSSVYQDIDVSAHANVIDNPPGDLWTTNPVKVTYGGYLDSYANGNDNPVLRAEFLDSSGDIINSSETSNTSYTSWFYVEKSNVTVPQGTRTVRFKMRSYRQAGNYNDGYFDDLSLKLYIPSGSSSGSWTGNQLANPGAESGLDGWHLPSFTSVVSPYQYEPGFSRSDQSGSRFWAATSEYIYAAAYQDIDLTAHASAVDGGGVVATLNGYQTSKYSDGDETQFRMLYLNSSGGELGSESTGYHDHSSWVEYTLSETLPVNTRTIRVIIEAKEDYGWGALMYGAFDSLSLTLYLPNLAPVAMDAAFPFGNLYLETETNTSPEEYNESIQRTFSFQNDGDDGSSLSWSLSFDRADTDNLIYNPGAESSSSTDLNGWESVTGFTATWSPSGSHSGNKCFWDGTSEGAWAYQDIDVSSHASRIDSGQMTASYSGGMRSVGAADGILEMYFLNSSGSQIPDGYHTSGWQNDLEWTRYEMADRLLPNGTRAVRVRMRASNNADSNNVYFDDLRLKLKWTSCQGAAQFSASSGSLAKNETQTVQSWFEGFTGNPGDRFGTILLGSSRGYREIDVSATAWRITQISHAAPAYGSNGEVNVALNASTKFTINTENTHPDAAIAYRWQKRSRSEGPGPGFDETSGPEKYYNFTDPGQYSIYCKAVEKLNGREVETDLLEILVHAWTRPTVADTPPQSHIDAGDVSWFSGKYAGVNGQPVRLMGDGGTGTTGQGESIERFLWSFDSDWDTIELEQPAGQVASYTWNNSKNDKIRCKAVTNFGVESHEKLFDLVVYDPLALNPGVSYTGRVNTDIQLAGSLENSYPGATIDYQWRVNGTVQEGDLKGDAVHQGDHIELTSDAASQSGQIEYTDLPLSDDFSVTGEFWTGGGSGADAFYVYLWASATPTSEVQAQGQYSIAFDEYNGNGEIQFYDGVSGQMLQVLAQPIPLDNSEWRPFRIVFLRGTFKIYLDHQLRMTQEVTNYATRMQNNPYSGFGARAGGSTNYHRVRNTEWTTGDPVETNNQGQAKYAWSAEGIYFAGLTARVTTTEGLVLEDTEFVEVRVEAGVPTAMPGGPYRGGIAGGSYSPIPFEGNHPDYVEADDVGKITDWIWFLSGGDGGSLQLDGQDDHVIVNPMGSFPTDTFTVEFWMRSSDTSRHGTPISYAGTGANDLIVYDYQDLNIYVRGQATGPTGISTNDGSWHHIAVTWHSTEYTDAGSNVHPAGEVKLYVDGADVHTDELAAGQSIAGSGVFVVGQEQDSVGGGFARYQAFEGNMDEVRVWNLVRSQDEIRADMGRELIGTETGLVLYYQFGDGAGMNVTDISPASNNGTLVTTNDGDPDAPDNRWTADGHPVVKQGIWNPTHSYPNAGLYQASLKVHSESGKWSTTVATDVEVVDGIIAGYVRAADLRTPVREVTLTLTSSHVSKDALARVAAADDTLNTTDSGGLWALTDDTGYYEFAHLPLGSYRVVASKGSGDGAHEFETKVKATELTLDGPNQLAIDFVDLSVFPVGGRVVYSIQKNDADVLVNDVIVTAQPVSSTSAIEALPSTSSLSAIGTNYSLPLFAGKYLFVAKKGRDDIRLVGTNPDDSGRTPPTGYDSDTGLVTIEDARTNLDFVDYTTRELAVFVQDSGGHPITVLPESKGGGAVTVEVSGNNGQADGNVDDEEAMFVVTLNPGEYTVTVPGAEPETVDVDLTGEDQVVTMIIPVPIEIEIVSAPPALIPQGLWDELLDDADIAAFMDEMGVTRDDIPVGYLYYYPPQPIPHIYTVKATANGQPVTGFVLTVRDEISQMTPDEPLERDMLASDDSEELDVQVVGGLPKLAFDDNSEPFSAPKTITFVASKSGYEQSEQLESSVKVLGDLPKGDAEQLIAIPNVNYTVLHDPPGDDSYSYLEDTVTIRGAIQNMTISLPDQDNIPVYPAPWSERDIDDYSDGLIMGSDGILDSRSENSSIGTDFDSAADNYMINVGMRFGITGGKMLLGKLGVMALAKLSTKMSKWAGGAAAILSYPLAVGFTFKDAASIKEGTDSNGFVTPQIQYEVRPSQRMQTPRGDSLPDLVGPGKGDIYVGEGWTLILRDNYRFGIFWNDTQGQWEESNSEVKTYTVEREEENQYMYTVRDIEQIISDLNEAIDGLDPGTSERERLESSRDTWQTLLDRNRAYTWDRYYVDNQAKIDVLEAKTDRTPEEDRYLADLQSVKSSIDAKGGDPIVAFEEAELSGVSRGEVFLFSGGPTFEYSRTVSEGMFATYTVSSYYYDQAQLGSTFEVQNPPPSVAPIPVMVRYQIGGGDYVGKEDRLTNTVESGQQVEQTVGFVLHDDDVGDQLTTYMYEDTTWGTPLFIQHPGSYSSDPWEGGTNKAVDVTLDLIEESTGSFDYHEGAHYTLRLTYTGARFYQGAKDINGRTLQAVDFALHAPQVDNNDSLSVRFNSVHEPYVVSLNQDMRTADIALTLYPPEVDRDNAEQKQYDVNIMVHEVADRQIARLLNLTPTFADLRVPRATIRAPYDGQRISPVFFPDDSPFEIEVVSEDTDLASIQLQKRSKQPDGVWELWANLTGMLWEDGGTNDNITVFDQLVRRPPHREFTFTWSESAIRNLGVGEYAIRAIATDKAGNSDIDSPFVTILVDEAKPSVLNSVPDYQARESERIYRGELSVTFTDDMRADDFDDRTFHVMDLLNNNEKVSGYVSYSPALRKVVFVPVVPFQPNGYYRVEVKTDEDTDGDNVIDERGVHDLAGNPLDNAFMWTFRTTDAPFEETWSTNWRVSSLGMTDAINIAAVEYGATDLEDEKDVRAVPGLAVQLRTSWVDRDGVELDRDIRPADGRLGHHWFAKVVNAPEDATVTLEFQPSVKLTKTTRQYQVLRLVEFGKNATGEIVVTNTINLDPTQASTDPNTGEIGYVQAYQYTNSTERVTGSGTFYFDASVRYFRLDVQKVGFVAGALEHGTSGWCFLSVPIMPQRAEPFVNLGDDIDPFQLFQYDTALGGYKVYPYDIGEVGLQTGHGYFTRLVSHVTADVGGSPNQDDVTLALDTAGWHAIGNPFVAPVDVADLRVNGQTFDAASSGGTPIVEATLYRWHVVTEWPPQNPDGYQAVVSGDSLQPWDGVWLKTNQDNVSLVIPVPPNLPDMAPLPDDFLPKMAPMVSSENGVQNAEDERVLRVPLWLTSSSSSDLTTVLGMATGAQTGRDARDSAEPPILGGTVAAYFEHPEWDTDTPRYNQDIRPMLQPGQSHTWELTVYSDNTDEPLILSWEDALADVPDDMMLWIQDALEGPTLNVQRSNESVATWLDMRQTTSIKLEPGTTKRQVEIRAERFSLVPPQDVSVVAGEQQVVVRWQVEENPFISGYSIARDGSQVQWLEGSTLNVQHSNVPTGSLHHEFTDVDVAEEQTYTYQVTVHYITGAKLNSEPFTVTVLPFIKETVLLPAYPNPFNPDTWIPYELEREAAVWVDIYDTMGRQVRRLDLGTQSRGRYTQREKAAHWDGRTYTGEHAASGIYFVVLRAGDGFTATRKLVIRK